MSIERSQRCGYALGSIALMGLWLHNLVNFSENWSKIWLKVAHHSATPAFLVPLAGPGKAASRKAEEEVR